MNDDDIIGPSDNPTLTRDDGLCESCGHDFAPHTIAAVVFGLDLDVFDWPDTAPLGGWVYCQLPDCQCHFTWSVNWAGFEHVDAIKALIPAWEDFVLRYRDRQSMS